MTDDTYPLDRATNDPPPVSPTGPSLWLGGRRRRGIELIARYASGWPLPGNRAGDVGYFIEMRDKIRQALEEAGRNPDDFTFAAQVDCGTSTSDREEALKTASRFQKAGADHVILGIPATAAPDALLPMAFEVAAAL